MSGEVVSLSITPDLAMCDSCAEEISKDVPDDFNPKSFYTMRFRMHGNYQGRQPGKTIIDASKYDGTTKFTNPHRVMKWVCQGGFKPEHSDALFRVNHYIFMGALRNFSTGGKEQRGFLGIFPRKIDNVGS